MAGQIRIRASFKKPTRPMAHAVSILSALGTALALESVLSCAICIRTQAQTTTLSVVSNGQSQLPGGLAGPTLNPANQPQGLAVPSHNAQPPSSVTSAMPGNAAGLKHRVTRGVGITSKPVSSTLCFQPGVGWIPAFPATRYSRPCFSNSSISAAISIRKSEDACRHS